MTQTLYSRRCLGTTARHVAKDYKGEIQKWGGEG